jgi:MATE family multidrug resistance protein
MQHATTHRSATARALTAADVRAEIGPLWRVAWPVVVAELGWMGMALVDTMLVGRVSPAALGGVAVGGGVFFGTAIFGMGLLLGLDFMVAHAFGAGQRREMHVSLVQGLYASFILAFVLTFVIRGLLPWLPRFGVRPEVAAEAIAYGKALTWSLLPLFIFSALRRYLQATNRVKPIMLALMTANVLNAVIAWALIFGHFGFAARGAPGAAWATVIARVYMCGFLIAYIWSGERRESTGVFSTPLAFDPERLRRLVRLGLPAALQLTLEVGVFVTATTIVGTLDAVSLAAHRIALDAASFTFMIPLGISSAAAVRVGQAVGRRDHLHARAAGWAAILLGALVMAVAGLTFVLLPGALVRIFTNDAATIGIGVGLLGIAAVFQLFDGVQVVSTGAMRGLGNTRTPMLTNLIGHWAIGLPLGCYLAFHAGAGVFGVWIGLCAGLVIVAVVLLRFWAQAARSLEG